MKTPVFALTALLSLATLAIAPAKAQQFVFGQPTSVQATPFNAFFLPTVVPSSTSTSFAPPFGFYHYFWLPQYTAAYNQLYSDFQYDLPDGQVSYEFTVIRAFEY